MLSFITEGVRLKINCLPLVSFSPLSHFLHSEHVLLPSGRRYSVQHFNRVTLKNSFVHQSILKLNVEVKSQNLSVWWRGDLDLQNKFQIFALTINYDLISHNNPASTKLYTLHNAIRQVPFSWTLPSSVHQVGQSREHVSTALYTFQLWFTPQHPTLYIAFGDVWLGCSFLACKAIP